MDYLIDTNVLVRSVHRLDPASRTARDTLIKLTQTGNRLCVTLQNASEFRVVCTRPRSSTSNGLGMSTKRVGVYFSRFEPMYTLLPETADAYANWKRLAIAHEVKGMKAHGTRLVAVMLAHGAEHIVTFNTSDFGRYSGITVVHPTDVLRS